MTDDLVKFLRARLDEDEQTARDAGGKAWAWEQHYGDMCNDPTCEYGELATDDTVLMNVHAYDVKAPWQGAAHIARNDPARVVAEVDAKRRIIEDCEGIIVGWHHEESKEFARDVLRNLAEVYADHPDYRDDWRP